MIVVWILAMIACDLLCGFLCRYLSIKKKMDGNTGFWLGLILGFFGLILIGISGEKTKLIKI